MRPVRICVTFGVARRTLGLTFLIAFLAGTPASPACLHLSYIRGHVGDYRAKSVLFDPLSVRTLLAHCDALQADSPRLSAEALLLTARLRDLTALISDRHRCVPGVLD